MPVLTDDPNAVKLKSIPMDRQIRKALEDNSVDTLGQLIAHDEWAVVNWFVGPLDKLSDDDRKKAIDNAINQFEKLRTIVDRRCVAFEGERLSPFQITIKFQKERGAANQPPNEAPAETARDRTP